MTDEPAAKRLKSASPSTDKPITTTMHTPVINEAFLNALIQPLVHPPIRTTKANSGLRVLGPAVIERPKANTSIRYDDIDHSSLPEIAQHELPIALDDPRRKYASGITGIKLTHPGGALEGGAGADVSALESDDAQDGDTTMLDVDNEDADLYAKLPQSVQEFIRRHDITDQEQLTNTVKHEMARVVADLRERMREREEAVRTNQALDEKIEELVAEREMERRVHERAREARRVGGDG